MERSIYVFLFPTRSRLSMPPSCLPYLRHLLHVRLQAHPDIPILEGGNVVRILTITINSGTTNMSSVLKNVQKFVWLEIRDRISRLSTSMGLEIVHTHTHTNYEIHIDPLSLSFYYSGYSCTLYR